MLGIAAIDLSDEGEQEFTEKLELSGVSDEDVMDTLARFCTPESVVSSTEIASRLGFIDG